MRKGRPNDVSCTIPGRCEQPLMSITSMGVPPLAKVTQSGDNISSLVETVVNPSSNLKGIIQ